MTLTISTSTTPESRNTEFNVTVRFGSTSGLKMTKRRLIEPAPVVMIIILLFLTVTIRSA